MKSDPLYWTKNAGRTRSLVANWEKREISPTYEGHASSNFSGTVSASNMLPFSAVCDYCFHIPFFYHLSFRPFWQVAQFSVEKIESNSSGSGCMINDYIIYFGTPWNIEVKKKLFLYSHFCLILTEKLKCKMIYLWIFAYFGKGFSVR